VFATHITKMVSVASDEKEGVARIDVITENINPSITSTLHAWGNNDTNSLCCWNDRHTTIPLLS